MRLISVKLCNFRQFYGKTPEIIFAWGERNTTVIYGNNGAGKTTILNAFTWVFYEKFSAAFTAENKLVNKRAITEAKPGEPVECWVEVAFEHDSKRYRIKRLCRAYKGVNTEYSKTELFLYTAGDDGRWMLPQQLPEDIIGQILPESLHQYFFFDGERIDQIVRHNKKDEIAEATKELLGVKVLNRSIEHLKNAKRMLEEELKTIGDFETRDMLREQEKLEQEIEHLLGRQSEIEHELEHQKELKKMIGAHLLELSSTKEVQCIRDNLEQQQKSIREQLRETKDSLKRAISSRGCTVLLSNVITRSQILIDKLKATGQLPTGIKPQFVRALLSDKRCICGAELIEKTHAYQLVKSWIDKADSLDIEETIIYMSVQVHNIDKKVSDFWNNIDSMQNTISQGRVKISKIETQLDNINDRLRSYPSENIQQLQKRLDETENTVCILILEQGENQYRISRFRTEVEAKNKQIYKRKMNEEKQSLTQRRITKTQEVIKRLNQVKTRLEQHFRLLLEKRIQEIFSQVSFTPYLPKLTDKYELTLVETILKYEEVVSASTGENQILSLSFIGGIIDRVREWSKNKILIGPDTSTFPIVMDSPFGSLDEVYRRKVARMIPQLANQLVVLVTKTQWRGEVAQEIENCIGKEYILVYTSPKLNCEEETVELRSERYPYVKQSYNEFEYTEILEIQRISDI